MEEGQRPATLLLSALTLAVLILVVMEEGQRQSVGGRLQAGWSVLILVVMEEGQRQLREFRLLRLMTLCLNPCCNGRGSKTAKNIKC